MHERALLVEVMRRIEQAARAHRASRVVGVTLRIGALCPISGPHLREHFERAARGTPAEGARLTITTADDLADPDAQHVLLESVEVPE